MITELQKNDHSMPYNLVSSEYHPNSKGEALKQSDAQVRQKALMRAETIQSRSYSQPFNPITGAPVQKVSVMLSQGPIGGPPSQQYQARLRARSRAPHAHERLGRCSSVLTLSDEDCRAHPRRGTRIW